MTESHACHICSYPAEFSLFASDAVHDGFHAHLAAGNLPFHMVLVGQTPFGAVVVSLFPPLAVVGDSLLQTDNRKFCRRHAVLALLDFELVLQTGNLVAHSVLGVGVGINLCVVWVSTVLYDQI